MARSDSGCYRSSKALLHGMMILALLTLGAAVAQADPTLTTFAEAVTEDVGTVTDTGGPQTGVPTPLSSYVEDPSQGTVGQFLGAGSSSPAHAIANQQDSVFGTFSALEADAVFASGSDSVNSMFARTTWQDSPAAAGPHAIDLFIKPGQLAIADYCCLGTASPIPITVQFLISLQVNSVEVFGSTATMTGGLNGHTFVETGTDLGGTFFAHPDAPDYVFGYSFDALITTIALGVLQPSDIVDYFMEVRVSAPGFETGGLARIGDPFDLEGQGGGSIDLVSVPEPSTALLIALGISGLAAFGTRVRDE